MGLGLVAGSSLLFAGHHFFQKGRRPLDEVLAGLGAAVSYATLIYAGFLTPPLMEASALLIGVLVLSTAIGLASYFADRRVLAMLSFLGGLAAPIVLRAPADMITLLFLYVVVLNLAALALATIKAWNELKLVAFSATLLLYTVYLVAYRPEEPFEPLLYLSVFFLVYFIGLLVGALTTDRIFDGLGLYLNALNCLVTMIWSMHILGRAGLGYTLPLLTIGALYVLASFLAAFAGRGSSTAVFAYFLIGLVVISISTGNTRDFFETPGIQYCLNAALWGGVAYALYLRGYLGRILFAAYGGVFAWFLTLIYWFARAWDVEWVNWFGVKFVPFVNPGALVWIGLAAIGFHIARSLPRYPLDPERAGDRIGADPRATCAGLGLAVSLVAHGVVAGLLTIQLQNVWAAYEIDGGWALNLLLSTAYTLHALLIFLWGAFVRIKFFRRAGSLLLVFVALKVLFFDLAADPTFMKAVYLMIMGGLTIGIGAVNARWKDENEKGAAG